MSDTPQEPDPVQEGGYGFPTLEQEVTPDVLAGGAAPDEHAEPAEGSDDGDGPKPDELEEDQSVVEPTD